MGAEEGPEGKRIHTAHDTLSVATMLARVTALLLAASTARVAAVDIELMGDEQFEKSIIMSPSCWAVLFTSATREAESAEAERLLERVGTMLPGLSLAKADVDNVKAFASEFNVRKRMVPRVLVFNSRARQAGTVKMKLESGAAPEIMQLTAEISEYLKENKIGTNDLYEKLTLAIGAGGDGNGSEKEL